MVGVKEGEGLRLHLEFFPYKSLICGSATSLWLEIAPKARLCTSR